jgi:hypothetical protein
MNYHLLYLLVFPPTLLGDKLFSTVAKQTLGEKRKNVTLGERK